ncbi:stress-response A/B barrel domain-containing protein UP3-like [Silene latifolia]|uniref:stress-response A/B barrel domain-containing protein UP3-like n=1 Tax=Silene latifolia TaxID=37657 RepID=UPI003D7762E7
MTSSPENHDIIEHVVLFNVKEEEDDDYSTKVNDMVNSLNSLNSLASVIYLTAGPIYRTRSSPLKYTHMLHARYRTLSDLHDYTLHPAHISVVDNHVRPLCEDVMAVDWSSSLLEDQDEDTSSSNPGAGRVLVPRPGSALRITFLAVEDDDAINDALEGVKKIKESVQGTYEQISYGKNFSERGKGFSVAALAVFSDLNELDACEEYEDQMRSLIHKVKGGDDDVIAVDYVVPRLVNVDSTVEL